MAVGADEIGIEEVAGEYRPVLKVDLQVCSLPMRKWKVDFVDCACKMQLARL